MAHLVVVEDDPDINVMLVNHFRKKGDEVTPFHRGQSALDFLSTDCAGDANTQMVLIDLGLPDMSGFEFITKIRGQEWGQEVPIIVISARTGLQERARALDVGADDFVEKPFSLKSVDRKSEHSSAPEVSLRTAQPGGCET